MGAGAGKSRRNSQAMKAAKRQALSGSAPGQVAAGAGAGGAAGGAGGKGGSENGNSQPSGSGSVRNMGERGYGSGRAASLPSFPSRSSYRRQGRSRDRGAGWAAPEDDFSFLKNSDEEAGFDRVLEADQALSLPESDRSKEVMVDGEERKLSTLVDETLERVNSHKLEHGRFGSLVLPGLASIHGAREAEDGWVITTFNDRTWAIANPKTNQIGCSCGDTPCIHRVAALVNAKLQSPGRDEKLRSAAASLASYHAGNGEEALGILNPPKKAADPELSLPALFSARESFAEALGDTPVVYDSTEANRRLQDHVAHLKEEFEASKQAVQQVSF